MTISEPKQVQQYYQKPDVAQGYIQKRFTDPLNRVEHQKQVRILNHIIKTKNCRKVLEFAPGPARVTAEVEAEKGTSIDASHSMLDLARKAMGNKKWSFIQGDILHMRTPNKHDLVFCFRFLLHFHPAERKLIYQQAKKALSKKGYLVFEAMNKNTVLPLRKILGRERYFVYDKLYTKAELHQEIESQGFHILHLYPILRCFWLQALLSRPLVWLGLPSGGENLVHFLEQFPLFQPYEWIVLCQKKKLST